MADRPADVAPPVPLLSEADPPPFGVINPGGRSRVVLIGDHAGNAVPAGLVGLGIDDRERGRHIGWDLGVHALGGLLASRLDAVFVHQRYSRLVIDCNRDPAAPDSIAEASDGTRITGNLGLSARDKAARRAAIFAPYHARIARELEVRRAPIAPGSAGPVLVALHSFTPRLAGGPARPWHLGVLHDRGDTTLSVGVRDALRAAFRAAGLDPQTVGDNEPYRMDGTDYTVPFHAYSRSIPYVEIEFRQDLLETSAGREAWGGRFSDALVSALGR